MRLASEGCTEIVKSENSTLVISDEPLTPSEYDQRARWSDRTVGTAILFSFFHGIELLLKGFLTAKDVQRAHHRLTELLGDFEQAFPDTELGGIIGSALPKPGTNSPIARFLASNSIQIDSWYEALKYPEATKGQAFSHFELKYGGASTLAFWQEIQEFAIQIPAKAATLSRAAGYA